LFEFHVSRAVRDRYQFDEQVFSLAGNVLFANLAAAREFAHRINRVRDVERHPELAVHPGALNALGLIDEALHVMVGLYRSQRDPRAMVDALSWFEARLGHEALERTLLSFADQYPTVSVYRGEQSTADWLARQTSGVPNRAIVLEEMILLWLANLNKAFKPFKELFDDSDLARSTSYTQLASALRQYFETRPRFGPENQNLIDLLRAPALASDSLDGQLAYIRDQWSELVGDLVERMLRALDVLKEEEVAVWMRFHPSEGHFGGAQTWGGDSSAAAVPQFSGVEHEDERFSPDLDWMPRSVMIAKSIYVWLDQLSKTYHRHVHRLDQIPDEELQRLCRLGFNGLWLIGVWERSGASQRIKQMCGNPEAAASAYSLSDYVIASELGGDEAYEDLRNRAWSRGIRLASDMVPNHMGIDSRWVIEHPDWFLSLPHSPFPAYTFNGPDVSHDGRVEIKIEDHYFTRTDAAVVFQRRDRWTGETRYIYHGNDGTSYPWNDTAQLNYLKPEVREGVIQTILHVARKFPIIRFDAAMTLSKRHYQRLWFPEPGTGGAIPSRAEHGLTKQQFDAAMPQEFWREVVDRVAAEAPNTLLLAEAFWLMESYFVRTLGMHRVYNSAFMNMLRDEENANYRSVIKNTLSFDPEVLKRYVNFMNNPDERTAVDQFGKGDKYFGICTLMATLPGLPMFGHGQIEGFTERYGMEYRRAYHEEHPDPWLVARHEREISPLLHRRYLFAEVRDFLLYDFFTDHGDVNEDVFAYSNRHGQERALIVFNNRYSSARGWVRYSCAYVEKHPDGSKHVRQRSLADSFGLPADHQMFSACHDALTGQQYLHRSRDLVERGMHVELHAYQTHVFIDWIELREDASHPWGQLCRELAGHGVPSLEDALLALQLRPVHDAFRSVVDPVLAESLASADADADSEAAGDGHSRVNSDAVLETIAHRARVLLAEVRRYTSVGAAGSPASHAPDEPIKTMLANIRTVRRLLELCDEAHLRWPEEAQTILPVADLHRRNVTAWGVVLAWCALEAIGGMQVERPQTAAAATAQSFDSLRLRQPLADALAALGIEGEERWRAAARLRATFAHAPSQNAPCSWIHDPDVAWVMGVHQHEGVTYVVKEQFERLLWSMAFRRFLHTAASPHPESQDLVLVQEEIARRMQRLAEHEYCVEGLEAAPLEPQPEPQPESETQLKR